MNSQDDMNADEMRKQVLKQAEAVACLAKMVVDFHSSYYPDLFQAGLEDDLVESIGEDTAGRMSALAAILQDIDVASGRYADLVPVFKKAHALWPDALPNYADWLVQQIEFIESETAYAEANKAAPKL